MGKMNGRERARLGKEEGPKKGGKAAGDGRRKFQSVPITLSGKGKGNSKVW